MNKAELIKAVSDKSDTTQADVGRMLDSLVDVIQSSVSAGDKVTLSGFGAFECVETAARAGRNPQTGAKIEIPAGRRPKFTAAKPFKDALK